MPKFVNTFSGGLDRDTVPTSYSNKKYYNARNFSIVVAEDLSSATLTNTKGVTLRMVDVNGASNRSIIGIGEIADNLVVFCKGDLLNGRIYKIPFSVLTGATFNLNDGIYLKVSADFDFGDRIEMIAREENTQLQKIYWVDGKNPIRFANLLDDISAYSVQQFEIYQDIVLTTPIYNKLTGGSLTAGVYQYAYRLYNQSGGQTIFSPLSQFIQITESGLPTTSTIFSGSAIGTATTSGVEITIADTNTTYDYVQVVSVFYTTPTGVPEVTIIYEGAKQNTLTISHTGTQLLGTLTFEEVTTPPNILIGETIASKYNYLFIGNIHEQSFDLDFDARTYRFNSAEDARMYNSDSSFSSNYITISYPDFPTAVDEYNLSPKNNLVWDTGITGANSFYKFKGNGLVLGGEGPNIAYNFITQDIPFQDSLSGLNIIYTTDSHVEGLGGYANPYWNAYVGYQRDEIYRFGIVFFNNKGQASFVKWIGDIRMPNYAEYPIQLNSLDTDFKALGLHFDMDFSTLPADIVSYQIVRAERTYDTATVVDCGYTGHLQAVATLLYWGGYSPASPVEEVFPALHSTLDGAYSPAPKTIVEYICPETNYNKNNYSTYDRLDTWGGINYHNPKVLTADTYSTNNWVLTRLYPDDSYGSSITIEDVVLFRAQRSNTAAQTLPGTFDSYSAKTRSHIAIDGSRGYKGTTLLLKLPSNLNPVYNNNAGYSQRRRLVYPYGGYSLSALSNTNYYPCSPIFDITDTSIDVFGGDTYISIFEYQRTHWADGTGSSWDGDRYAQIVQCLVESKLNLNYTVNPRFSTYDDNTVLPGVGGDVLDGDNSYIAMWEVSGTWEFHLNNPGSPLYFIQDFNLYTYNPVYSLTTGQKVFVPKPTNFEDIIQYPTRVYRSEKKINGELTDSWLQFLVGNSIDVDNQFGSINRLYNHNNRLIYFQNKGFGVIPVEDREVVNTSTGAPVSIGTGAALQRYDYISTNAGTSLPDSVVGTESNLYFIDNNLKKICEWNESEGVNYISDLEGMYSYMSAADLTSAYSIYNPKSKEVMFSLTTDTIVWNEYTKSFAPFTDILFKYGIYNNGNMFVFNTIDSALDYISCATLNTGEYGKYSLVYPTPASRSSSVLDLIINPARQIATRYDIMEISTEASIAGVNQPTTTFTSLRVRNNYQDTGTVTLTPTTNLVRRFRTWRYNQLRNSSDDGRLIDNYARLTLTFDNDGVSKLVVSDVQTTFAPLNLR
jgi:hypothetical protein